MQVSGKEFTKFKFQKYTYMYCIWSLGVCLALPTIRPTQFYHQLYQRTSHHFTDKSCFSQQNLRFTDTFSGKCGVSQYRTHPTPTPTPPARDAPVSVGRRLVTDSNAGCYRFDIVIIIIVYLISFLGVKNTKDLHENR